MFFPLYAPTKLEKLNTKESPDKKKLSKKKNKKKKKKKRTPKRELETMEEQQYQEESDVEAVEQISSQHSDPFTGFSYY